MTRNTSREKRAQRVFVGKIRQNAGNKYPPDFPGIAPYKVFAKSRPSVPIFNNLFVPINQMLRGCRIFAGFKSENIKINSKSLN